MNLKYWIFVCFHKILVQVMLIKIPPNYYKSVTLVTYIIIVPCNFHLSDLVQHCWVSAWMTQYTWHLPHAKWLDLPMITVKQWNIHVLNDPCSPLLVSIYYVNGKFMNLHLKFVIKLELNHRRAFSIIFLYSYLKYKGHKLIQIKM